MEPITARDWIRMATAQLGEVSASPRLEAEQLLAHARKVERSWLFAHPEAPAPPEVEGLLDRRRNGEPLAYILGYREFYGRSFRVGPGVLIPRQDTETLVEAALEVSGDAAVLDIGTGSGILAITLKLERPTWVLTAVDISPEALKIAQANGELLNVAVQWRQSDLFEAVRGERFDLIVSNPPYIGREEPLAREVADFEPELALYAEENGLAIYRKIASDAHEQLTPEGRILLEVGYRQADSVTQLFEAAGYSPIGVWKDLSGIPRVVGFRR